MRIPKGDHICTPPHTATLRAATLLYQMLHCSDVVVDFGKSISDFLNHCSAAIVSWGLIGNRHETTTPAMRLSVHELMLVLVLVPIVVLVLVPVLEVIPMQRSHCEQDGQWRQTGVSWETWVLQPARPAVPGVALQCLQNGIWKHHFILYSLLHCAKCAVGYNWTSTRSARGHITRHTGGHTRGHTSDADADAGHCEWIRETETKM